MPFSIYSFFGRIVFIRSDYHILGVQYLGETYDPPPGVRRSVVQYQRDIKLRRNRGRDQRDPNTVHSHIQIQEYGKLNYVILNLDFMYSV